MGALSVRLRLAATGLLVLTLAGCSSDSPVDGEPPAVPSGPTTLQPAEGKVPSGTTRVTCAVEAADGPVRLALDLPSGFRAGRHRDRGCTWRDRVRMHDSDIPYSIDVVVSVATADGSLDDVHAREEPFLVEGDSPEGDDSILDLLLDQGVPALGPTLGDRLSWRCYCDGQDLITRMAQADGVRVTWSSVVPLTEKTDAAFARAVDGAGTV
ncbi:hypothetical protein [Nocardioides currus]|uniref:DUF3558 domain-containing protein n=1 Tax=Nocardioides currus TaxID=2133958 RepID=A0A2R7Z3F8_9ACTN|nr:hypothetical protein [Nocardioides currus]PUA82776.1 hypothetical protein C7S10_03420 [Nocardioides currus]